MNDFQQTRQRAFNKNYVITYIIFWTYLFSLISYYFTYETYERKTILIFEIFLCIIVFMLLYITSIVNMMWFWFYINVTVVRFAIEGKRRKGRSDRKARKKK